MRAYERTPPVTGDATRLGQVFLNLPVNAAQAIPEGRVRENSISVRLSAAEGLVTVGMDVHREISRQDPTLAGRLVFMTGGTFTESAQAYFGSIPNVRVEKPFGKVALVEAIVQTLTAA